MPFFQAFVMLILSYAIQALTAPKPNMQKLEPGALDTPTAEEGSNIPVCFGTNIFKDANVVWYGDSKVVPIRTKSGKK